MEAAVCDFAIVPQFGLTTLKNRAKKLRNRLGLKHNLALETTAHALGYTNYEAARGAMLTTRPCEQNREDAAEALAALSDAQHLRELAVVRAAVPAAADAQVKAFVEEWSLTKNGYLLAKVAGQHYGSPIALTEKKGCSTPFVPPSFEFSFQKSCLLTAILGRDLGAFEPNEVLARLYNFACWRDVREAQRRGEIGRLDEDMEPVAVQTRRREQVDLLATLFRLNPARAEQVMFQLRPTSKAAVRISYRVHRRINDTQAGVIESTVGVRLRGTVCLKKLTTRYLESEMSNGRLSETEVAAMG